MHKTATHDWRPTRRKRRGPPSLLLSRGAAIVACAVVLFATILAYAGQAWLPALSVLCTDGLIALLWVIAAAMLGSLFLPRVTGSELPADPATALRLVTSAALGLGLYSLAALLLGLAGALNRTTAILLPSLSAAIFLTFALRRSANASLQPHVQAIDQWLRQPAGSAWLWIVAMPFLGMAAVGATLPPGILWLPNDPHPYDVLEYHLQVPREWYAAGRITPLKHNAFSYFPFNVEMQYLLAMHVRGGPWAGMYLAQLITLGYMILTVIGVYAIARTLAARAFASASAAARPSALPVLAGVAAATTPWLAMLACVAYNESGLLLYSTLAIAWLIVAFASDARPAASLALAGAMAGLACGVKYTALPILLMAAPLAFAALSLYHPHVRTAFRKLLAGLALYLLMALALCSPWLLRNVAWTGNPVFPEAMRLLGHAHFSPEQVDRWERAHSRRPDQNPLAQRFKAAKLQITTDWRYGLVLLPLAIIAAGFAWRRPDAIFLLAMLAVLTGFWLGLTHLQSRFFVLAIPLAAMLLAAVPPLLWLRPALTIIIVAGAVLGWGSLDQAMSQDLVWRSRTVAIGVPDLSPLLPEQVSRLILQDAKIALIGDAAAFAYVMPMGNLRYRTIFDLDVKPGQPLIDAWLGPDAPAIKATHYLVINPSELQRFAATYAHVPLPRNLAKAREIIVLPPGSTQLADLADADGFLSATDRRRP